MDDSNSEYESDLNSQDLEDRAREAQPKNTRRSTAWAISVYKRWAARRQQYTFVKADLLEYRENVEELNKTLFKFYNEAHTVENEAFTPSSLQVRIPTYTYVIECSSTYTYVIECLYRHLCAL